MHRDVEMQGDGSECVAYGEDSGAQGGGKGERVKGKSVCGYLSMSLKGGRVEISLYFERGLREIFCHIAERGNVRVAAICQMYMNQMLSFSSRCPQQAQDSVK